MSYTQPAASNLILQIQQHSRTLNKRAELIEQCELTVAACLGPSRPISRRDFTGPNWAAKAFPAVPNRPRLASGPIWPPIGSGRVCRAQRLRFLTRCGYKISFSLLSNRARGQLVGRKWFCSSSTSNAICRHSNQHCPIDPGPGSRSRFRSRFRSEF